MRQPRTLSEFLHARIAQEENTALDSRAWFMERERARPPAASEPTPEVFAAFLFAHTPDRILRECAAKRQIIKLVTDPRWPGSTELRESLLRLLAIPYADHPGFRDEWHGRATRAHV